MRWVPYYRNSFKGCAVPRKNYKTATLCANAQIGTDTAYNAVIPPLYLSSTYKFDGLDKIGRYDYGRSGNPNRDGLAEAVARLEGGAGGVVTSSGMAAIDVVLNFVEPGATVIAPHDCYGGTHRLLMARQKQGRFNVEFIDQSNHGAVASALKKNPGLLLIETPSNPVMRVVDISALCKLAHDAGTIAVCDNTFLSPARQLPFSLGADFVIHSATKYINGHSDVVGGVALARTQSDVEELQWWANCTGVTGAPFDSYLTLRGLRTLNARMDVQEANTKKIADFLEGVPSVSRVYYPGLKSDPGYILAQKQQSGPGAMLSFEIDANRDKIAKFLSGAALFQLAESLGGTESLICHPSSMTHRAMDDKAQKFAGIHEGLIRVSVGLEDSSDQLAELKQMFESIERN